MYALIQKKTVLLMVVIAQPPVEQPVRLILIAQLVIIAPIKSACPKIIITLHVLRIKNVFPAIVSMVSAANLLLAELVRPVI